MNPKKCAFGVVTGKFLRFRVHQRGINVDPSKIQQIATAAPPMTMEELKSFLERLLYIRRFIPGLAAQVSIFTSVIRKDTSFHWMEEHQNEFEAIRQRITNLPTGYTRGGKTTPSISCFYLQSDRGMLGAGRRKRSQTTRLLCQLLAQQFRNQISGDREKLLGLGVCFTKAASLLPCSQATSYG